MSTKIFGLIMIVFLMALSLLGWYYLEAHLSIAPKATSRIVGYEENINAQDNYSYRLSFVDWLKEKVLRGEQRLKIEIERFL